MGLSVRKHDCWSNYGRKWKIDSNRFLTVPSFWLSLYNKSVFLWWLFDWCFYVYVLHTIGNVIHHLIDHWSCRLYASCTARVEFMCVNVYIIYGDIHIIMCMVYLLFVHVIIARIITSALSVRRFGGKGGSWGSVYTIDLDIMRTVFFSACRLLQNQIRITSRS